MKNPLKEKPLLFTPDFLWLRKKNETQVVLGLSNFAQENLGPINNIELLRNKRIQQNQDFMIIESLKAVIYLKSPINGSLIEVNQKVLKKPSILNQDPLGNGWLICLECESEELDNQLNKLKLMDSEEKNHWEMNIKKNIGKYKEKKKGE